MRKQMWVQLTGWLFAGLLWLFAVGAHSLSTAPTGPITYLQPDLTGNVILATDPSGDALWNERYLPYGGKRIGSTGSSTQRYGYHEKALDPETGLQYFGARFYDPASGRFSGMDPKESLGSNIYSVNRYSFANGNPYRYTDPDGKIGIDILFVAYDVYKLATEGATTTNLIATGLDVASTFGFGFGAGAAYRVARVAEHAAEGIAKVEEGAHLAEASREADQGFVYLRKNPVNGEKYVGQAKSEERYLARQGEHDSKLGVDHEYEILGRAKPGKQLDRLEESEIRRQGGLQKEGGELANKRHQMTEKRFQESGGMIEGGSQ